MVVYFFDDKARRRYRKEYKDYPIDGIKIYRDNIITTPFAENEQDPDKKRDILGIDKRLWQDIFNRVSTREIIGFVDITYDGNPKIIDATNRQDFVDNVEYRDLKDFIILQLNAIQDYKIYIRQTKKKEDQNGYNQATDELDNLIETVSKMASDNPSLQKNITPVIHQVKKTKSTVQKAFQEHKKAEEEFARKENMFMSIMSLQDYAIHITHAVRTTVNKIREEAEYFSLFYPNEKYESMFLLYSKKMFNELTLLNKVVDYMLSYSKSNLQLNDMDFGEMVDEVLNSYNTILNNQQVRVQREFQLPAHLILHTNKMFFRDILQNLIDNSIKALQHSKIKLIKLTAFIKDKELVLLFSDTGVGVPIEKREWVFGLYNTTTEDQGGGGIGLYIVKTRMEALQGSVSVINSEFGIIGTTLELKIPFKN